MYFGVQYRQRVLRHTQYFFFTVEFLPFYLYIYILYINIVLLSTERAFWRTTRRLARLVIAQSHLVTPHSLFGGSIWLTRQPASN